MADTALQNGATGSNSLSLEGISTFYTNSVNIGYSSEVEGSNSVALGASSSIASANAVAIGKGSGVSNNSAYGIAIGSGASVMSTSAIQVGYGTNSTAKTLSVGFYDASTPTNYTLLDGTTGKIPAGRLNISSSVSSSSTNDEVVGSKLFYDTCGDIEATLNAIRGV